MGVNLSASMNLPVPQVGNEAGPQYATDINNCLTLVDQHDHSPGYGVKITPAGININADLAYNNNNLTLARSLRLQAQSGVLMGASDLDCLYTAGVDLYYNDGFGNNIRITQSGGIAGTPGSIANLVPPASVTYSSINQTFVFQSNATTPAILDGSSVIIRNLTANSFGLTLSAPTLVSDYTVTLPTLPGSTLPVSISASGVMSAAQITQAQLAATVALVPPGAIIAFGGTSAPFGYLMCDGSSQLNASYPGLFSAIGTAYGSADGSHFNVPDLRGLFARGVDSGAGNDPDAASRTAANPGGNTGDNVGSYEVDQVGPHDHLLQEQINSLLGANGVPTSSNGSGSSILAGGRVQPSTGSETRPKNVYVNYIIKT